QIATGDDARSEEQPSHPLLLRLKKGEVRERPNRAVSKTAVPLRGPWVRIPPSPPTWRAKHRFSMFGQWRASCTDESRSSITVKRCRFRDFEFPPSPPYHTSCDPPLSINSRRRVILPPVDIDSLARETSVLNVWAVARQLYQRAIYFHSREKVSLPRQRPLNISSGLLVPAASQTIPLARMN